MRNAEARILTLLLLCSTVMTDVSASPYVALGVKSGQWIRYSFQETFTSGDERWQEMEFLTAVGTTITIHVTANIPAGMETDQTETVDLASSDDFPMALFNVRVFIIPADLKAGDSIYLGALGNRTINGELTRTYAGASRKVVFSNFSQDGSQYTFYWDEQTGVLTEGTMAFGVAYKTLSVTETNLWSGDFSWWLWIIGTISIIIAVSCGMIISRKSIARKLHRKK